MSERITLRQNWKLRFAGEWGENAYIENIRCTNCRDEAQVLIKRGVSKGDVQLDMLACPHCGCKTMDFCSPPRPADTKG